MERRYVSNNYNLKFYQCQTAKNVNLFHTLPTPIPTCENKAPPPKLPFCYKKIMHNISKIYTAAKKTSAPVYNSIEYHTKTNSLRNVWSIITSLLSIVKTNSNCYVWTVFMEVPYTKITEWYRARTQLEVLRRIMRII